MPVPPTAVWTDLSLTDGVLHGSSSISGPFELPFDRILAVGQHVLYPDDADPLLPDTETWVSILTAEEFGLIHGSSWSPAFTETLARDLQEDRLHLLLWPEWLGWDSDRGNDTRFLYPAWVFGLPVYEWPREKDSTGALGATAAWLVERSPQEQQETWESWLRAPTPAQSLGPVRYSARWTMPFQVWWLSYAIAFVAAMTCGVYWDQLASSPGGWAVLAATALFLGVVFWQPEGPARTSLHDHGVVLRTGLFGSRRCFYAEMKAIDRSDSGLAIRTATETLRIPASQGVYSTEIEDLAARSQALLFAQSTTAES